THSGAWRTTAPLKRAPAREAMHSPAEGGTPEYSEEPRTSCVPCSPRVCKKVKNQNIDQRTEFSVKLCLVLCLFAQMPGSTRTSIPSPRSSLYRTPMSIRHDALESALVSKLRDAVTPEMMDYLVGVVNNLLRAPTMAEGRDMGPSPSTADGSTSSSRT